MGDIRMEYHIGIRMASRICGISSSAYYYQPIKKVEDEKIKGLLRQLAEAHPRWGFGKMMGKIKQTHSWNHKRVYRIYCELHLNIRIKPRKRILCGEMKALSQPLQRNVCWSMDFMTDVLSNGRPFRTLNILDDFNREVLLIEPSHSFPATKVIRQMDQLAIGRGYPEMIRVDNGPEFSSKVFKTWAKSRGVLVHYIQPGKPAQNGFIERFNRTYREDILDMNVFNDMGEVKEITRQWMQIYNAERPHESLGNLTPVAFARAREGMLSLAQKGAVLLQQNVNSLYF